MVITKQQDCEYTVVVNDEIFKVLTTDENHIVMIDGISRHTTDNLLKQIQTKLYEYNE